MAALLAALAGLGAFLPIASNALFTGMTSHPASGLDSLLRAVLAVTGIPLVTVVAGVAAVGLYRRARWGRRLGLLVAGLLLLAPAVALVTGAPSVEEWGLAERLSYHLLLLPPNQASHAVVGAVVGIVTAWGLLSRPKASTSPVADVSVARVHRPSVAMLLLLVLGVESLAPYLAWLVRYVQPVAAHSPPIGGSVGGPDVGAGLLLAIASLGASTAAFVAARAIRSRAQIGPYVAPMASAIAGSWSAAWLLAVGLGQFAPFDGEGPAASPGSIVLGTIILIVALVALIAPAIVTVSVFRRLAWFLPAGGALARPRQVHLGRAERLGTTAILALAAPVVIASGAMIANPPPPPLLYNDVLFEGRAYRHVAPLSVDGIELTEVGSLADWTEGLAIADPATFTLPGIDAAVAIVVKGAPQGAGWDYGLFMLNDSCCSILPELCRYVPLEDPTVFVESCGPPWEVRLDGATYRPISEGLGGFVVNASDLSPLGTRVVVDVGADPRVDLEAREIRGVPRSEAFALGIGSRIVLYRRAGRQVLGELCRYSPAAMTGHLPPSQHELDKGGEVGNLAVPSGCELPYQVWLDGRVYGREDKLDALLVVALEDESPLGAVEALEPEAVADDGTPLRVPFPPGYDATAHRIAGVDPSMAIALVVGDRVVMLWARGADEFLPLPAVLCPFVRPESVEEFGGAEAIGCPP